MQRILKNSFVKVKNYIEINIFQIPIIKNILHVYLGDSISKIFAVMSIILLIRSMSVNSYAMYTIYYSILILTPTLIGEGINQSLVRNSAEYISINNKKPLALYLSSYILQICIYLLVMGFAIYFHKALTKLFFDNSAYHLAFIYGLIGGFGVLLTNTAKSILQSEEKFAIFIRCTLLRQISIFLTILIVTSTGKVSFNEIAPYLVAIELTVGLSLGVAAIKNNPLDGIKYFSDDNLKSLKSFIKTSVWIIGYFFAISLSSRVDVFMLSHLSSQNQLGNYGVAFRYYALLILLQGSINTVLLAKFSKVAMQDPKKQQVFMRKWIRLTSWTAIPIILIYIFGKPIFLYVNGASYNDAFFIFSIFLVGIWLGLMLGPLVNVLFSQRLFKTLVIFATIGLLANIIGSYILIPRFGGAGAAAMTVIANNVIIQLLILFRISKGYTYVKTKLKHCEFAR